MHRTLSHRLFSSLFFAGALAAATWWAASPAGAQTPAGNGAADRAPAASDAVLEPTQLSGLELRTVGPANMSGRIVDLAVAEKDTYVFYVASATGGLWKTTDNGITFEPVFERQATHSIGDVAVHQADTSIVWVGTGERANRQSSSWGDGVYKSVDGGETWTNMGLGDTHHIGRIVLHPTDPNIVYVAALGHLWGPNEERGLYESTDGGETWDKILYIDENTGVVDVAMDPSNPEILYAAAYQRRRRAYGFHGSGAGSGLWKSTDAGETWTELTAAAPGNGLPAGDIGRIGISIYRSDPRVVYVSIEQGIRYNASTAYEERRAGIYRSEDHGETWTHMSDWNPRPMYASQILVDPNDDQRIYMVNSYSFSDDGGKTFTEPDQSLHGDDRIVWVDPNDSRHVMKGDDGGLGISYDRGLTWLYITSLPLSQFYRVAVDSRKPFWIYGGLQDNGSWAGPSATYRSEGVLNENWIRTGGGDGFVSLPDTAHPGTIYSASQYLGIQRVDLETHQTQDIRPGDPHGHIDARRNWEFWGTDETVPPLANAMAPANWDAAYILSPHDPNTLYAGTNILWKSTDQGRSWTSLGDMTTGVDRSELEIMGQAPDTTTLSLDDGIPYYPSIAAIAESPLEQGVLYVGTDDGNVQVSRDGGASWTNVADRFPSLPPMSYVGDIEASEHDAATVYVAFDNHRSDDFANYLYRSTDYGRTWQPITGDLPADRVIRRVHDDPRNPAMLYAGTELGFFLSTDRGRHWVELQNNMPTLAINDFVIHPRDNDLVLGTHGRGIWILDNINALQELTPEVVASSAHLFTMAPAEQIRYAGVKAHAGDMVFRGENPPAGAIIDYWLGEEPTEIALTVHDAAGTLVRELEADSALGVNRVVWDLHHAELPPVAPEPDEEDDDEDDEPRRPEGPWVVPGTYTVRLAADGRTYEQSLEVREDPRIDIEPAQRLAWTETLQEIAGIYGETAGRIASVDERMAGLKAASDDAAAEATEVRELLVELQNRVLSVYGAVMDWTGPLTADQRSQMAFFRDMLERLDPRVSALVRE